MIVSINVSIRSAAMPEFRNWLREALRREPQLARRLSFEVPEHGIAGDEPAAQALAEALAGTGAGFAVDHFGAHRDSLALMRRLKPAYVKLAAAHTKSLLGDAGTRFFAESLINAARQLEIPVIAQNVEDDEVFQSLASLGFAGYQGNLGGKPAPWPGD
jgi:EAL domain-containing protein (putative c-di-GMP-specific phosphodiesterase class I)